MNQCAACSTMSEEQWSHLCKNFAKRSAYRICSGSQDDNLKQETEDEPVFTSEELSQVVDTLLDLELEQTGNIALVTSISPLANQPSSVSISVMSFPAHIRPVLQSSGFPALFRAPDPVLSAQETIPMGETPNR